MFSFLLSYCGWRLDLLLKICQKEVLFLVVRLVVCMRRVLGVYHIPIVNSFEGRFHFSAHAADATKHTPGPTHPVLSRAQTFPLTDVPPTPVSSCIRLPSYGDFCLIALNSIPIHFFTLKVVLALICYFTYLDDLCSNLICMQCQSLNRLTWQKDRKSVV